MARHSARVLGAIIVTGACLALAACSSSGSATASPSGSSSSGPVTTRIPVKNGTVVVRDGSRVICVMKVVNGKGTCKVKASEIGVGTSRLSGVFTGPGYGTSSGKLTYTVLPSGSPAP
ncbi:MAG TPA: hypothetical protein VH478_26495 [Trebonia sp.]|jgi:hypothetical protein|nr:hypothetical protein [Trebonia sp.]